MLLERFDYAKAGKLMREAIDAGADLMSLDVPCSPSVVLSMRVAQPARTADRSHFQVQVPTSSRWSSRSLISHVGLETEVATLGPRSAEGASLRLAQGHETSKAATNADSLKRFVAAPMRRSVLAYCARSRPSSSSSTRISRQSIHESCQSSL